MGQVAGRVPGAAQGGRPQRGGAAAGAELRQPLLRAPESGHAGGHQGGGGRQLPGGVQTPLTPAQAHVCDIAADWGMLGFSTGGLRVLQGVILASPRSL